MSISDKIFAASGDILAALGGAALAHVFIDGDRKKGIRPDFMRENAPHFAKSRENEAYYSRLLTQLDPGYQKAIDGFMSRRGEHQQADFIISVCEHTYCAPDGDKAANIALTLQFLKMIAEIDDDVERVNVCNARNFMKGDEDDYLVVKLQNMLGVHWNNRREFEAWLQNQTPQLIKARNFLGITRLNDDGTPAPPLTGWARFKDLFSLERAARRFK
jgi:hypothetical protein